MTITLFFCLKEVDSSRINIGLIFTNTCITAMVHTFHFLCFIMRIVEFKEMTFAPDIQKKNDDRRPFCIAGRLLCIILQIYCCFRSYLSHRKQQNKWTLMDGSKCHHIVFGLGYDANFFNN